MNPIITILCQRLRNIFVHEEGQDLVEYALVLSLLAFGAVAQLNILASDINTAFSDVAATLSSNIS